MNKNIELKILEGYLSRHKDPAITKKLQYIGNFLLVIALVLITSSWAYKSILAGNNSMVLTVSCFGAGFNFALGILLRGITRSFTVINEYIDIERIEQRIKKLKTPNKGNFSGCTL